VKYISKLKEYIREDLTFTKTKMNSDAE